MDQETWARLVEHAGQQADDLAPPTVQADMDVFPGAERLWSDPRFLKAMINRIILGDGTPELRRRWLACQEQERRDAR